MEFVAFFWAIFFGVYVSDRRESIWLWILAWFIFFVIFIGISIIIDKKNYEEEIQRCDNYLVNPYYPLDIESLWYEYAAKWSPFCNSFLSFDIEDLVYSSDDYLKWELSYWCNWKQGDAIIDCIEYNISRFEEWCDEYWYRKELKESCLDDLNKKRRE